MHLLTLYLLNALNALVKEREIKGVRKTKRRNKAQKNKSKNKYISKPVIGHTRESGLVG